MQHDNSALFFQTHADKKEFWWTPDGQHFFTEAAADAHAVTLKRKNKKNTVEHVTREELTGKNTPDGNGELTEKDKREMAVEDAKNKAAAAQTKVDMLTAARDAAKEAVDGLAIDAKPAVAKKANDTLSKATDGLAKATAALEAATAAVTEAETALADMEDAAN